LISADACLPAFEASNILWKLTTPILATSAPKEDTVTKHKEMIAATKTILKDRILSS
jgi:hypothetical protein